MPLPDFDIPSIYDLRRLWAEHRHDPEVRCLILEIVRTRDRIGRIEDLVKIIDKCWKADAGGNLVALENLRVLLLEEGWRHGAMEKPSSDGDRSGVDGD